MKKKFQTYMNPIVLTLIVMLLLFWPSAGYLVGTIYYTFAALIFVPLMFGMMFVVALTGEWDRFKEIIGKTIAEADTSQDWITRSPYRAYAMAFVNALTALVVAVAASVVFKVVIVTFAVSALSFATFIFVMRIRKGAERS